MIQIYNCKKRFNYVYLWTSDSRMQKILLAYCEGRSFLWNMFFGWRKTDGNNQMFFWMPSRKIEGLIKIAENF